MVTREMGVRIGYLGPRHRSRYELVILRASCDHTDLVGYANCLPVRSCTTFAVRAGTYLVTAPLSCTHHPLPVYAPWLTFKFSDLIQVSGHMS